MSKNFVKKTLSNKNQINLLSKAQNQINLSFQCETTKFDKFQVVWAKISGYPWWPAVVTELADQKNMKNSKHTQKKKLKNLISDSKTSWNYRVDFIADETHAYLQKKYLLKFQQNRDRLVTQGFGYARRKARFFEAAINEADQIHQAMETSKNQVNKKRFDDSESELEQIEENQNNLSLYESGLIEEKEQKNENAESSEQKQLQNYIKLQLDQDLNQNLNESIIVSSQGQGKNPLQDLTHHLSNQSPQLKPQNLKQISQIKSQKIIQQGEYVRSYSQIVNQQNTVNELLQKYQLNTIPDLLIKFKENKKTLNLKKKENNFNLKSKSFSVNNESQNIFDENSLEMKGQKIKGSLSNKINIALKRGRKPNIKIVHKSQFYDITFISKLKDSDISQSKKINLYSLCRKLLAKKVFYMCKVKIFSQKKRNQQNIRKDLNLMDYLRIFSLSIADSYFNLQNEKNKTLQNLCKRVNQSMKFLNVFKNEKWMKKNCQQLFGCQRYLLLQNLRKKLENFDIKTLDEEYHPQQICKSDQNQKTNFITPSNQLNNQIQQQIHQGNNQNIQNELNIDTHMISI